MAKPDAQPPDDPDAGLSDEARAFLDAIDRRTKTTVNAVLDERLQALPADPPDAEPAGDAEPEKPPPSILERLGF
jgi:hypothetical protein